MDDGAARFRSELEERTGEKVMATTAASSVSDDPGVPPGWGVLVLTDASLRFVRQPDEHWLSSMFRSHDRTSPPRLPAEMVIPLGDGSTFTTPRRGLLSRIFSPPFERLDAFWQEDGEPRQASFSVDPASTLLVALKTRDQAR